MGLSFAAINSAIDGTSSSIIIGVLGAVVPIVTIILNNKFKKTQKKYDMHNALIQSDLEELSRQREFFARENKELWGALKEELEECRVIRQELETFTSELKEKIMKIENELSSWKMGLRVPEGYVLVREEDLLEDDE